MQSLAKLKSTKQFFWELHRKIVFSLDTELAADYTQKNPHIT